MAAFRAKSILLSRFSGGLAVSRAKLAVPSSTRGFVSATPTPESEGDPVSADPSAQSQGGPVSATPTPQSEGGHVSADTSAQSQVGGECFKCGKLGHWAKDCDAPAAGGYLGALGTDASVPEKACPCGLGACLVLTAHTERNRGRKFYKCPVRQEFGGCGFFEWCDGASGADATTYGGQNRAWSPIVPVLMCPCGAGSCMILTARTGGNYGRKFYRCPSLQGSCGFFQWCVEHPTRFYGYSNNASKSFGLRTGSSCFKCGGEGHWARECSQSPTCTSSASEHVSNAVGLGIGRAAALNVET